MYTTPLQGREVIDDSNAHLWAGDTVVGSERMTRGYDPEITKPDDFTFAAPFDMELIPRDEWRERIEEKDKTGSNLSDARKQHNLKSTNQGSLPYCWAHGCVNTIRLLRASRGLEHHNLEPTMVGALVKGYAKRGGNTWEAIKMLSEVGCCTTDFWEPNKLDRSQDNVAMRENAAKHKITDWYELERNSFDAMATCLLTGMPVSIGLSWWGHMICAMDLVALDGGYGVRIWNSWGDGWEDNGEKILSESKGTSFDQFALTTALFESDREAA